MGTFEELYERAKKVTDQLLAAAADDDEKQKKAIAQAIRTYRVGRKMTLDELALKLGVSKMQVIRWEQGKHMPNKLGLDRLQELKIL